MASGKRTDLFLSLQSIHNTGKAEGKAWKLVLDSGIRWNATYSMIRRAIELKPALIHYARELNVSNDDYDLEISANDFISTAEWETLELMMGQLEPLFRFTKDLEGNADLQEAGGKASHGALWEILPVFDRILSHFEDLEQRAKRGEFNNHAGIQNSITLAWQKAQDYYNKTDASIAWMAALVFHPRFKWAYFERNWNYSGLMRYVQDGKRNLRQLWERQYKEARPPSYRGSQSPPPAETRVSYIESILNDVAPAPSTPRIPRPSSRRDELWLYLEEPPTASVGMLAY